MGVQVYRCTGCVSEKNNKQNPGACSFFVFFYPCVTLNKKTNTQLKQKEEEEEEEEKHTRAHTHTHSQTHSQRKN
jgi:hypothetical protein